MEYPLTLSRAKGEMVVANNANEYAQFARLGFNTSHTYEHQHFPKALHKPPVNGVAQSISVANEEELEAAKANKWKESL